jgi:hypothetical protein
MWLREILNPKLLSVKCYQQALSIVNSKSVKSIWCDHQFLSVRASSPCNDHFHRIVRCGQSNSFKCSESVRFSVVGLWMECVCQSISEVFNQEHSKSSFFNPSTHLKQFSWSSLSFSLTIHIRIWELFFSWKPTYSRRNTAKSRGKPSERHHSLFTELFRDLICLGHSEQGGR